MWQSDSNPAFMSPLAALLWLGRDQTDAAQMVANLSAAQEAGTATAALHNLPALVFGVLLIVVIICGNLMVCLSVFVEKALKTTTNYFIVSLAVADLMLAVLVLPLFVYSEVRCDGTYRLWRC